MNDGILHEANESSAGSWLPNSGMVSMLDILGGGIATCDQCGRWQRFSAITPDQAKGQLSKHGWTFSGDQEMCPECS